MAKYHASPRYTVGDIRFNAVGEYVTEDSTEIKRLDALVPTWIKRVDVPNEPKTEETDVQPAPKQRKPAAAKTSEK